MARAQAGGIPPFGHLGAFTRFRDESASHHAPQSADDLARIVRVEDAPDEEMRRHLSSPLLVVRSVRELDHQLCRAERAHGEARAREVLVELAEELRIPDSDRDGPQCVCYIGEFCQA
jgi:hypothetical protein